MKAGFWIAPEGAEQPVSVFPIGAESLDAAHSGLRTHPRIIESYYHK